MWPLRKERAGEDGESEDHRWSRNPRPRPQKFSKLLLLMNFS